MEEELTLAELDLYDVKIDEFDIEGTLSFAEHLVSNASRLWIQAGLDQRQRLQKVFFPEGVTFDGKEFRTPRTCPLFSNFEGTSGSGERLVDLTHPSSNTLGDSNTLWSWLREVAELRQAA